MHTLDTAEMANMIRRECEAGNTRLPVGYDEFESRLAGFNRKYLEEMMILLGLTAK